MTWLSQIFGLFQSLQWWIVVAPWEQALRVRLGKTATVLQSGMHFRIPFLDRIFVQSVRLRMISAQGLTMTTKDKKCVTLSFAVAFSVEDIGKLYNTVQTPELTLIHEVEGIISSYLATRESVDISPSNLEAYALGKIPEGNWGLSQCRLIVTSFAFVRVYRLLNNEYRSLSSMDELEKPKL